MSSRRRITHRTEPESAVQTRRDDERTLEGPDAGDALRRRIPRRGHPRFHPGHHHELRRAEVRGSRLPSRAPRPVPGQHPAQHRARALRHRRPRARPYVGERTDLPARQRHHLRRAHRLRDPLRQRRRRRELRAGQRPGRRTSCTRCSRSACSPRGTSRGRRASATGIAPARCRPEGLQLDPAKRGQVPPLRR